MALSASRNTPEWSGAVGTRYHLGLVPVEASSSLYVGGIVCRNANGRAVKAQALGAAPLDQLRVLGIVEYVHAGGIMPPGINALNVTGNGALYPAATGTLGAAGAIYVGVANGIFGWDVDSTITDTTHVGQLVFASDDHTVSLGTSVANSTSITIPSAAGVLINVLLPNIVRGTFNAYQNTGGTGTHYREGTDFAIDYEAGLFATLAGGSISANGTVYITYYHSTLPVCGRMVAFDGGLAYVDMRDQAVSL